MVFSYSIAQRIVGRLGLSLDEQRRFLKSLSDAHHTKFDKKLGQLGTKVERAGARAAEQELGFDDAVMVDERSLQEVRSKITSFLKDMKSLGPSAGVDQCYRVSVEVGPSIESIRSQ